jgi:signal transduction protein with GAF and PtsI domain
MLAAGILLSGCEDPEARTMVQTTSKEISDLKAQISELKSGGEKLEAKLKSVQEDLRNSMNERIDKASDKETAAINDLLQRVAKDADETRKLAQTITESSRGDFDKELENARKTFAGDLQKIRDEMVKSNEDLKKFMDNQLRELYPYAYQPKRMDPNTAPAPESK